MSNKYYYDIEFLEGTQTKRILGIPYGKTPPTIDLISIGIVSEDNRELYLISKDFNLREAWDRYQLKDTSIPSKADTPWSKSSQYKEYWIRENVLLPIYTQHITGDARNIFPFSYRTMKWIINQYGHTNAEIAEKVYNFCSNDYHKGNGLTFKQRKEYPLYNKFKPELYGYYADYDHVVLCFLFGTMRDLPEGFPWYTIDLKQMLDEKVVTQPIEFYRKLECDTCTHNVLEFLEGTGKAFTKEFRIKMLKEKHPNYPKQINEHNALADAKWNKELHKFIQSL